MDFDSFLDSRGRETPEEDTERYVSYSLSDLYPDWQDRAHCKGVGHEMYFGSDAEKPTMSIKQVRNAAKLCDICPVFEECLRHALEVREEYGVWAGTSGRTRRRLFAMLDNGETTVSEIVEVTRHGRRSERARVTAFPGAHTWGHRVRDAAPRDVAL